DAEHFIDQYLDLRGYKVNDTNRDLVALRLEAVPGRPPYRAHQLVEWLDEQYKMVSRGAADHSIIDTPTLGPVLSVGL
ncbi:MAG TPA: hypothetical protein VF682_19315, partial [Pseudomonas sp.]